MKNIEEFIVKVSEKDIDLLNKKIDLTRWPDEINENRFFYLVNQYLFQIL